MFRSIFFALATLFVFTAASPMKKRSISSPIMDTNFADPGFIQAGNQFFAFSTNSAGLHVPVATSPDFVTWTRQTGFDALPTVGNWSNGHNVWAPDVVQLANGLYIMYYSAESIAKDSNGNPTHCIGAASSTNPKGPYTPVGDAIQCHLDQGGAIDAAGFQDSDGRQYVTYKIDGNGGKCSHGVSPIHSTPIMLQQVNSTDGWLKIGDPVQILDRSDGDGPLVEAPSLTRVPDSTAVGGYLYVLFFSSHCYDGALYDTSYATSVNGVAGPYTKSSTRLLVTGSPDGELYSPGGLDVEPRAARVMFHADRGNSPDVRLARTGEISINVGSRVVTI